MLLDAPCFHLGQSRYGIDAWVMRIDFFGHAAKRIELFPVGGVTAIALGFIADVPKQQRGVMTVFFDL